MTEPLLCPIMTRASPTDDAVLCHEGKPSSLCVPGNYKCAAWEKSFSTDGGIQMIPGYCKLIGKRD